MITEPKQWHWVLPAVVAMALAWIGIRLESEVGTLVLGAALILGLAAGVSLLWLAAYRWVDVYTTARRARAVTPESELAHQLRHLAPESQTWLINRFRMSIERHLTTDGSVAEKLGPTGVAMEWVVNEYIPRCNGITVCPTGTWGEGSINRLNCEAVTRYLQDLGMVLEYGGGNQAARWAPGAGPAWLLAALGYRVEDASVFDYSIRSDQKGDSNV